MLIKLPPPLLLFITTSIYVGWEGVSLKKKRKARMIHSQLLGVSLKKKKESKNDSLSIIRGEQKYIRNQIKKSINQFSILV